MTNEDLPSAPSADAENGNIGTSTNETPLSISISSSELARVEKVIGYTFKDRTWLERALTHRSALSLGARSDYERLEFLGDAVLDLAMAHLLSDKYSEAREGGLSKMRAALVNTQSLAETARTINLGSAIRLGRGEYSNKGYDRPSILADVMEALIGAVYHDGGYENAFNCIDRLFSAKVATVAPSDPKTELQELMHVKGQAAPEYLLEFVEGPEHSPTFVSVVKIGDAVMGRGRGATKKASQQVAASEALEKLRIDQAHNDTAEEKDSEIESISSGKEN